MGKFTPEMEGEILDLYAKYKSYTKVAKIRKIDWRSVKRVITGAGRISKGDRMADLNTDKNSSMQTEMRA
jgi:hypothetical protein